MTLFRHHPITDLPRYRPQQMAQTPPCQGACAANGDVRGWIGLVAQRTQLGMSDAAALRAAWEKLVAVSPFPAVMGRVCPHPCESGCNRDVKDEPISINAMERFLGDWAIQEAWELPRLEDARPKGDVAVVGAGPAGLSFGYQMARRGHGVTIYDRHPHPGGMLRYGIPDYRLPPRVLDAEVQRIVDLGVEIRSGVDVGVDVSIDTLISKHDATFVAVGAQAARPLGIPGEGSEGVWSGIEYLEAVNSGSVPELGSPVMVVGGGNTAVDAARIARRFGAAVSLHYRRTRAEMPAIAAEVDDAVGEGVELHLLEAPVGIGVDSTGLLTVTMQQMRLGDPDLSGRRRPEPVDGATRTLTAAAVISAVSQAPALEQILGRNLPPADTEPLELPGRVWVGGDALHPAIAGTAIKHGRLIAEAVHSDLVGEPRPRLEFRDPIAASAVDLTALPMRARASRIHIPVEEALSHPHREVSLGLSLEQFMAEAERCFSCGLCHGCSRCYMYCTVGAFVPVENPRPGRYYDLSLAACTECGKCIEVCPCGYLSPQPVLEPAIGSGWTAITGWRDGSAPTDVSIAPSA